MTFPDPLYNSMDFNSAYPYSFGDNPFFGPGPLSWEEAQKYEGADIAAPFTNNYPEGPQDGMASTFSPMSLREIFRYWSPPFNHLAKMEDALPEELR